MTVEDCKMVGTKRMMLMVNIETPSRNGEEVVASLKKLPSVRKIYAVP